MTMYDDAKLSVPHTPGLWQVSGDRDDCDGLCVVQNTTGGLICLVASTPGYAATDEANARRIVAAVNACGGISTEALERGIVAEMRLLLGELLTAAGDLDAAIDGVTDQFDAERNRLNAILRMAHTVLDIGTEINVHELLASRGKIAHIWGTEDVQDMRPDLSKEQAWQVLQDVERRLDSQYGICWDMIEIVADELFGLTPETAAEED